MPDAAAQGRARGALRSRWTAVADRVLGVLIVLGVIAGLVWLTMRQPMVLVLILQVVVGGFGAAGAGVAGVVALSADRSSSAWHPSRRESGVRSVTGQVNGASSVGVSWERGE